MSKKYGSSKTGLHDIPQIREQIQMYLEIPLSSPTLESVLIMELLLHIYDGLDIMDSRLLLIERHLSQVSTFRRVNEA